MRWSYRGLSQPERVRLYTVQSLYAFLWGAPLIYLLVNTGSEQRVLALTLGAMGALCVAGTWLIRAGMAHYLDPGPLPVRPLLLTAALAAVAAALALALGLDLPARVPVLLGIAWVLGWAGGTFRERVVAWPLLVLVAAQGAALGAGVGAAPALVVALFAAGTVRLSLWILAVVLELDRARDAQASLAVAEERLRFSRDVHDVLGRDLSTIAVTSELAASLARRADPRAEEKMLEVRTIAHDALREARRLARGYRAPELEQEISGARELLTAAGVAIDVDVDGVPERWREVVALTVREGVTNVLRHSQAHRVEIGWTAEGLVLRNDGAGPPPERDRAGPGQGLLGLRERIAPLGGSLETHHDDDWFELRLRTEEAA